MVNKRIISLAIVLVLSAGLFAGYTKAQARHSRGVSGRSGRVGASRENFQGRAGTGFRSGLHHGSRIGSNQSRFRSSNIGRHKSFGTRSHIGLRSGLHHGSRFRSHRSRLHSSRIGRSGIHYSYYFRSPYYSYYYGYPYYYGSMPYRRYYYPYRYYSYPKPYTRDDYDYVTRSDRQRPGYDTQDSYTDQPEEIAGQKTRKALEQAQKAAKEAQKSAREAKEAAGQAKTAVEYVKVDRYLQDIANAF